MSDILINATGTDTICLWYLRNGHVQRRYNRYRSWIFVCGSGYDMDFLARQLDLSPYMYEWSRKSDIFGPKDGITIWARPSWFPEIIRSLEVIGLGRRFRIYNGDLNPQLRFLSENSLDLLHLDSPMDPDPDIRSVEISGHSRMGIPESISIDGGPKEKINSRILKDLECSIRDSLVVVYDNRDQFFSRVLQMMYDMGCTLPATRSRAGKSYRSYGHVHSASSTVKLKGKICVESGSFVFSESGLTGLLETSRVSSLPMEIVSMVTAGTAVSSMEESEAIRNDILIPLYKDDHEREKDVSTLIMTDMGGMVLQPEPGLYMDVHEIDFSSMYPSITVRYNLSPETVGREGSFSIPGTPYFVNMEKRGFLSWALEKLLERRLLFKSVKGTSDLYRSRDAALKWMLLTSFGYTGYKNAKFGRIEVHEAITAMGRNLLMKAISISREEGFRSIHGIVDSLWITGSGDIERVIRRVKAETGIGIVEDGHYRWIVFLPARSGLGALNRYFGLRTDGTFKVRGIHMRRSDSPKICVDFQEKALEILRECNDARDILSKRKKIEDLESVYLRLARTASWDMLKSGIRVTRHQEEYRVRNIQSSLISEFRDSGIDLNPGERRYATVVDRKRKIVDPWDSGLGSDREYYSGIMKRAFEPFDFLISACSVSRKGQKSLMAFS